MLILLSPSKRLDYESTLPAVAPTQPALLAETKELVAALKQCSRADVQKLMGLSDNLAQLNYERYQHFSFPLTAENARPALFAFKGDVYDHMDVADYAGPELAFAQQHVRILSGLYGVLRPLDLMQPYRLEMGTKFKNARGANLYQFWQGKITQRLNDELAAQGDDVGDDVIVNLASTEYFSAVQPKQLNGKLLTVDFKQRKGGKLKTIGLMAKRARGMMTDYIIKHKITDPAQLSAFAAGGYQYATELSTPDRMVFTLNMDA